MEVLCQGPAHEVADGVEEGMLRTAQPAGPAALAGLQHFSTQPAPRVVHIKAAAAKPASGCVVLGVGWGLGATRLGAAAGAPAAGPTGDEQPGQQGGVQPTGVVTPEDITTRKQVWALRKTFGLEAAVLQDKTAQLDVCGAGAWQ